MSCRGGHLYLKIVAARLCERYRKFVHATFESASVFKVLAGANKNSKSINAFKKKVSEG
jgi:hypothetical protein